MLATRVLLALGRGAPRQRQPSEVILKVRHVLTVVGARRDCRKRSCTMGTCQAETWKETWNAASMKMRTDLPMRPKPPEDKPRDVIVRRSDHPKAEVRVAHSQGQGLGQPSVLRIGRTAANVRRQAPTKSVYSQTMPGALSDRANIRPALHGRVASTPT